MNSKCNITTLFLVIVMGERNPQVQHTIFAVTLY